MLPEKYLLAAGGTMEETFGRLILFDPELLNSHVAPLLMLLDKISEPRRCTCSGEKVNGESLLLSLASETVLTLQKLNNKY